MNKPEQPGRPAPKVSITYSWEDEAHQQWVKDLASRLRGDDVDVSLDQWVVDLGMPPEYQRYSRLVIEDVRRTGKARTAHLGDTLGFLIWHHGASSKDAWRLVGRGGLASSPQSKGG